MIVVAIIGLLLAMALPNFGKARTSARVKACVSNLKTLEGAKNVWALENHKAGSAVPTQPDILPFLSDKRMPVWPGNGTYRLKRVDKSPSCSLWASAIPCSIRTWTGMPIRIKKAEFSPHPANLTLGLSKRKTRGLGGPRSHSEICQFASTARSHHCQFAKAPRFPRRSAMVLPER